MTVPGAALVALYVLLACAPAGLAAWLGPSGGGFLLQAGRSAALVGFTILVLQGVLAARWKWVTRHFGLDVVLRHLDLVKAAQPQHGHFHPRPPQRAPGQIVAALNHGVPSCRRLHGVLRVQSPRTSIPASRMAAFQSSSSSASIDPSGHGVSRPIPRRSRLDSPKA